MLLKVDASHVKRKFLLSQLGCLTLRCDAKNPIHIPSNTCSKPKRVVLAVMAGKVSALLDGSAFSSIIAADMKKLLNLHILVFISKT